MDYKLARYNMVEQQIRPWDVLDFDLLDVLDSIPREAFVTDEQKAYAYADTHLPLPNGFVMLEPKIVARLIQGLSLKKTDRVLEIATGSGYATAVMASMAQEVITQDTDKEQLARAQNVLTQLNFHNITFQARDGLLPKIGTYFDAIYIGGALHQVPESLFNALNVGGRLVAITGTEPVMQAHVFTKISKTDIYDKVLFDTLIPYLDESKLAPYDTFVF